MRYRRKPKEVEAIQYTGYNYEEIRKFCSDEVNMCDDVAKTLLLTTNHGIQQLIRVNDYVIKHNEDFTSVTSSSFFEGEYEPVEESYTVNVSRALDSVYWRG